MITPLYVLTAAHCINQYLVGVRLGEHSLTDKEDCDYNDNCLDPVQDFDVKVIRHKDYTNAKRGNDIALLKLSRSVDFTKNNVQTICVPLAPEQQIESLQKTDPKVIKKMAITGWGRIENGRQSDVPMKAYVPYVENSACKKRFTDAYKDRSNELTILPTFLCAGGDTNKEKVDTVSCILFYYNFYLIFHPSITVSGRLGWTNSNLELFRSKAEILRLWCGLHGASVSKS